MKWQPIETCKKIPGRTILVYGLPSNIEAPGVSQMFIAPSIYSAFYSLLDDAFLLSGGFMTEGPFVTPTHWMPLPEPPVAETP